jgi:hypothetical protein
VIDPPDGRLPSRTARGEELAAAAAEARALRVGAAPAAPSDLSPWVRCITRGLIPTPGGYNNGMQIVQGPGYVTVTREMVHETRVVPTEPRPSVGENVTSYLGHSQGRWEGDTLVVESTNFNGGAPFQGSSKDMTLVERYTRIGPNTLEYQFTIDDPTVWTRPWTAMFRWELDDSQYELVEYACQEGNYGMTNILSGARARDAAEQGSR